MQIQNSIQQQHLPHFRIKPQTNRSLTQPIGHYKIGELIGKGGFAKVYKATELHSKMEVAVKIIKLEELSSKDMEHLRREIQIHKSLNHPNIVRIYEVVWTQNKVYIFMELIKGQQLFDRIRRQGPLAQDVAVKIFHQIVMAVKYLHDVGVAHRDIKTQNIIIDENMNAKLIDFGLAKSFANTSSMLLQTFCGSPSYTAPELLQKRKYSGQCVDIWCLGVTLYVLLQACLPFDDFDKKLRQRNIHFLNWHKPLYSSLEAIDVYQAIFTKQKCRITIETLLEMSFFKKYHFSNSQSIKPQHQNLNLPVVHKVCKVLGVTQKDVQIAVSNTQLGEIYCLYFIYLSNKDQIQEEQRKEMSKSQLRRYSNSRLKSITLEPLSNKIRGKSRPQSPNKSNFIKIIPVLEDPFGSRRKHGSKQISKIHNDDESLEKYKTGPAQKIDLIKDSLKIKANQNNRLKNIFAKDLQMPMPKPRLREDSPDSPKRLLDCVKRYN